MGAKANDFITRLASTHRVVTIGGLAVIAHGRNRPTKDADVWLEPFSSPHEWADHLCLFCEKFLGLTLRCLQEMAAEGDPFCQAILKKRPIPYTDFPPAP